MKNVVIAAGYATRLGELTKNFPKPLLKIGNSTILGRMLDDIDKIDDVDEHIIITNHKFAGIFEEWKKDLHYSKPITIVDDGTETNDTRLGAVCDLLFAMDKLHIDDDYIYLKKDLDLVRHSVENGCGKDAPGNLAHYMVENTTMHAWPMSAGRFDIGSYDTYEEAKRKFG